MKRQNKFLISLFILIFSFTTNSFSEDYNSAKTELNLADSLFQANKYTQSFELYDKILQTQHFYSPAMLLKMAFIKEGLSDYTQALYYLNLYYQSSSHKRVLKKMEKLAEAHKLSGYDYDDIEYFQFVYKKNKWHIVGTLVAIAMALLIWAIIKKGKENFNYKPFGITVAVLLILAVFLLNFSPQMEKGIISASVTHVMDGPSPGAHVVDIISKGHRVDIQGHDDVWVEITWNDKKAFVNQNNLKEVVL